MLASRSPTGSRITGHSAAADGKARGGERSPGMSRLTVLIRRLHEQRMAARPVPTPRRSVIFDHVPKTGGTALNQALLQIFTPEHVAVNRHVDIAAGNLEFADRYPIISGHFGGSWRRRLRRDGERVTFAVVRDPIDRAISSYNFWRHRIPSGSPEFWSPMVQAAKTLPFAAFIRASDAHIKDNLFNLQFAHLAGGEILGPAYDPEDQAPHAGKVEGVAAEIDVVGVTERLPETLQCVLDAIGARTRENARSLLAKVERNASPRFDPTEVSSEDRAFLMARNQLDLALHSIAADRLDRAVRARRRAAFKLGRARGIGGGGRVGPSSPGG